MKFEFNLNFPCFCVFLRNTQLIPVSSSFPFPAVPVGFRPADLSYIYIYTHIQSRFQPSWSFSLVCYLCGSLSMAWIITLQTDTHRPFQWLNIGLPKNRRKGGENKGGMDGWMERRVKETCWRERGSLFGLSGCRPFWTIPQ